MDAREGGFIVIARKVRSSPLYQSLTAEQRSVFIEVLLACNWKATRMLYVGKWVDIDRGEFVDSLETIARRAGVSVKVVRSTYVKLMAHGESWTLPGDVRTDGEPPFMVGRWTGTEEGRGLRVLRVLKYDDYQRITEEAGTASGSGSGTAGARNGHDRGTTGAPSEPVEPVEPTTTAALRSAETGGTLQLVPAPPPKPKPRKERAKDPAAEALRGALCDIHREVRGEELDWPDSAHGELAAIRKVLADDEEVKRRWRLFLESKYWPTKNVHKFREAFQHASFQRKPADEPAGKRYPSIPEFR